MILAIQLKAKPHAHLAQFASIHFSDVRALDPSNANFKFLKDSPLLADDLQASTQTVHPRLLIAVP